jgi:hypothetical protein
LFLVYSHARAREDEYQLSALLGLMRDAPDAASFVQNVASRRAIDGRERSANDVASHTTPPSKTNKRDMARAKSHNYGTKNGTINFR